MRFDINKNDLLPVGDLKTDLPSWSDKDINVIKDPKVRRALGRAGRLMAQEQWEKALPHLLKAWDAMPDNTDVLTSLAFALVKLGVRDKAIAVLERALRTSEPTVDLLNVLFSLANNMQFFDIAEKIMRIIVGINPADQHSHLNLLSVMTSEGKVDEAIAYAQSIIPLFPENGGLWGALANAVYFRDGAASSYVFFEEALKFAPNDFKIHNNYAGALDDPEKRKKHFQKAVSLQPDSPEPHMGMSFAMFLMGDMAAAYPEYRWRLHEERSIEQRIIYTHKFTEWQGEPLDGKTIFVTNEQGLGDEIFFMQFVGRLQALAAQVIVACDHRLFDMIKRSYPGVRMAKSINVVTQGYKYRAYKEIEAEAEAGDLTVDYFVHMGELMRHFWPTRAEVTPSAGFLSPDTALVQKWISRFEALGTRPKIGVAWTSLKSGGARSQQYLDLDILSPILTTEGVDFICVQYGDKSAEISAFEEKYGVKIHTWDDFNIKDDLDDNLALMSLCDAIIGPANAALHIAAFAKGGEPWWILHDRPWWSFGGGDTVPWLEGYRLYNNDFRTTWDKSIAKVRDDVAALRDVWRGPKWEV